MQALRIALVSSEIAPYAKTGGLADVSAALGRFLARRKHDVRLVMPMYARVRTGGWTFRPEAALQDIPLQLGGRRFSFSISTATLPKSSARVHFVRCPELYERDGIYTQDADEHVRFALLSRAALTLCQHAQWAPDIVHCNDWHTALIPLYLRTLYAWDKLFERTRSVLTIHNLGYQGVIAADRIGDLGLADERRLLYQEDLNEGRINLLKTGLLYANALTTVSRTYAREIQTAEQGMGLDGLLRQRSDSLFGIVNGIDDEEWNPGTDPWIAQHYDARDPAGKARCKQALCERLGLRNEPRVPLVGIVSRLTAQKGFELLPDALPVLLQRGSIALAVLGSGEERYESYFRWLAGTYPGRVGYDRGYKEELSHQIEAGADLFLMPSRYEPCGLNQMYSLKYGTVPVVRRTGGLADTVEEWNGAQNSGTGFLFDAFEPEALLRALRAALAVWEDPAAWARLVRNGMQQDYSWERQGEHYLELYRKLAPARSAS